MTYMMDIVLRPYMSGPCLRCRRHTKKEGVCCAFEFFAFNVRTAEIEVRHGTWRLFHPQFKYLASVFVFVFVVAVDGVAQSVNGSPAWHRTAKVMVQDADFVAVKRSLGPAENSCLGHLPPREYTSLRDPRTFCANALFVAGT